MHRTHLAVAAIVFAGVPTAGSALAATDVVAPKKITVSANEYSLKFSSMTAKPGQTVTFTFVNRGTEVHDLKFTGLAPKSKFVPGGSRTTFKVTFKKKGRYQYLCTIGEHALKGMRGTFIVK